MCICLRQKHEDFLLSLILDLPKKVFLEKFGKGLGLKDNYVKKGSGV